MHRHEINCGRAISDNIIMTILFVYDLCLHVRTRTIIVNRDLQVQCPERERESERGKRVTFCETISHPGNDVFHTGILQKHSQISRHRRPQCLTPMLLHDNDTFQRWPHTEVSPPTIPQLVSRSRRVDDLKSASKGLSRSIHSPQISPRSPPALPPAVSAARPPFLPSQHGSPASRCVAIPHDHSIPSRRALVTAALRHRRHPSLPSPV